MNYKLGIMMSNKQQKSISSIVTGMPTKDGAGVSLTRIIGQPTAQNIDPFLMLDEIRSDNPNNYIAGFPAHPHKGFETLSYMIKGSMEHKDSTGGSGLINSGGVQYMTAGKGIIHSEKPKQDDGLLFGFQLWINLPASEKLTAPRYVDIPADNIPKLIQAAESSDSMITGLTGAGKVSVIAGQLNNVGPLGPVVRNDISMSMFDVTLQNNSTLTVLTSPEKQGVIYVYDGNVLVNGKRVEAKQAALIASTEVNGTEIKYSNADVSQVTNEMELTITSNESSGFLILLANPIGEPIVQYGPFVMNNMAEIDQALKDYQSGQFI